MNLQTISNILKNESHNLRTPMNAILGFSKMAQNLLSSEDAYYYSKIYNAALKMQRTLDKAMGLCQLDYAFNKRTKSEIVGHVLVVDDDIMNRQVAEMLLTRFGLKVDLASGGVDALEAVTANNYDVILMDLQMPGVDGFITSKAIRNKGITNIPIIALTADLSLESRKKCSEVGMAGFLTKPIVPNKLHSTLEQWLG